MPSLDYFLTTDIELTKEMISDGLPRELTPNLDLGKDNRTWNKSQLNALKLVLCNIVDNPHKDNGVFLYSRDKKQIPSRFNPTEVSYSSLIAVIDKLIQGKVLKGKKAPPRKKGEPKPNLRSEFHITQEALDFAYSLGINKKTITTQNRFHIRLRDRNTDEHMEFDYDEYTKHIELEMSEYSSYLNEHNILIPFTDDYGEQIAEFGKRGQPIHLYRNFRNYTDYPKDFQKDIDNLWIEMDNYNFQFGGRSGGYWQSTPFTREDRKNILIDGKEVLKADFPACHINLCYLSEELGWYQQETNADLVEEGRGEEDAYYIHNVPRDLVKQMVLIMFNVKGRPAVSRVWNRWLKEEAEPEQVRAWKFCDMKNLELVDAILKKHWKIKDYFLKGKLAGQIIQFEEANMIHDLAMSFIRQHGFPVLTVYDELIVWKDEQPMVQEFMFSMGDHPISKKYSLMNQIKNL